MIALPGDVVKITHTETKEGLHFPTTTATLISVPIEKEQKINTVAVGRIVDDFGFKDAIIGILGDA